MSKRMKKDNRCYIEVCDVGSDFPGENFDARCLTHDRAKAIPGSGLGYEGRCVVALPNSKRRTKP